MSPPRAREREQFRDHAREPIEFLELRRQAAPIVFD
jgi:hypothetical protein